MTTNPTGRLPQFITDGGIETHIIFNMGVELPHFSTFPLNDSATGREIIRSYYRDYLPVARAAGRSFLFATDSWRSFRAEIRHAPTHAERPLLTQSGH